MGFFTKDRDKLNTHSLEVINLLPRSRIISQKNRVQKLCPLVLCYSNVKQIKIIKLRITTYIFIKNIYL